MLPEAPCLTHKLNWQRLVRLNAILLKATVLIYYKFPSAPSLINAIVCFQLVCTNTHFSLALQKKIPHASIYERFIFVSSVLRYTKPYSFINKLVA
jgi:hypothetical protein